MTLHFLLAIYLIVFVGFFSAIRFEAQQRNVSFSWFQLVVALFWPIWAVWYGWVLLKDRWHNRLYS